ncbi:MAG: YraN family protein [Candidatus Eisenbacteria bacterium]
MSTRGTGSLAERLAAVFLEMNGYSILEAGYRFRGKEIDLVATRGATIAFVEVKFRSGDRRGLPREAVGEHKRRHIVFAARGFLAERRISDARLRFDVVEVVLERGGLALRVEHLPAAFRAEGHR